MIDTIFYFVQTDAEYQLKRALGQISNKTIVFVEDTREIYLNGRGYGKTSTAGLVSDEEFDQWKSLVQTSIDNLTSKAAQDDQALANEWLAKLDAAKTQLLQAIANAQTSINETSASLSLFVNGLDGDVQTAVNSAVEDALKNNRGESIWTVVGDINDGLSVTTNKLNGITDANGDIKYTSALQSVINTGIDNNQAITNISNRWAVLNENQAVIEWLASGFKSLVDQNTNFASIYSAGLSNTGDAIALAKTEVKEYADGKFVASTELSSRVTTEILNGLSISSLADIALKSDVTSATATVSTTLGNSITQLQQKSTEQDARLDLLTTVTTPAGSQNSVYSINEANLDAAMARILASSGSSAASQVDIIATGSATGVDIQSSIDSAVATATAGMATTAYVDGAENRVSSYLKDGNGNIITSASLQNTVTADHATLTALTGTVNGLLAGMITDTGLDRAVAALLAQDNNSDTKAAITAAVSDDQANVIISADKIYLDATHTLANTIEATQGNIGGYTISSNGLEATNTTTGNGISITTDHIQTVKNNVPTNNFNADGSGFIASGGFSWNNNGTITISQDFLRALFTALGNGQANGLTYGGMSGDIFSIDSTISITKYNYPELLTYRFTDNYKLAASCYYDIADRVYISEDHYLTSWINNYLGTMTEVEDSVEDGQGNTNTYTRLVTTFDRDPYMYPIINHYTTDYNSLKEFSGVWISWIVVPVNVTKKYEYGELFLKDYFNEYGLDRATSLQKADIFVNSTNKTKAHFDRGILINYGRCSNDGRFAEELIQHGFDDIYNAYVVYDGDIENVSTRWSSSSYFSNYSEYQSHDDCMLGTTYMLYLMGIRDISDFLDTHRLASNSSAHTTTYNNALGRYIGSWYLNRGSHISIIDPILDTNDQYTSDFTSTGKNWVPYNNIIAGPTYNKIRNIYTTYLPIIKNHHGSNQSRPNDIPEWLWNIIAAPHDGDSGYYIDVTAFYAFIRQLICSYCQLHKVLYSSGNNSLFDVYNYGSLPNDVDVPGTIIQLSSNLNFSVMCLQNIREFGLYWDSLSGSMTELEAAESFTPSIQSIDIPGCETWKTYVEELQEILG